MALSVFFRAIKTNKGQMQDLLAGLRMIMGWSYKCRKADLHWKQ